MSNSASHTEIKLSQWEALTLESLRSKGWSDEQIIEGVQSGKLPADDSKFQFDYSILTALAAEQEQHFLHAVKEGYRIKYNTIRGIHSWILVALGHEGYLYLEPGEEAVYATLSKQEAERLSSVLSYGWQLEPAPADKTQQLAEQLIGEAKAVGDATHQEANKEIYEIKPMQFIS